MHLENDNSKSATAIERISVGTRYPKDRVALLDAVSARWGKAHRADVIEAALDRLLISEGLLDAA